MGRRILRSHRKGSRRRKSLWSESVVGLTGALANNAVATGWLAFPAGQYFLGGLIPIFQPEDLTHVRSLFTVGGAYGNQPSTDRASSVTVAYGVLPFSVEDGNAYQNVLISTSGIGGVPNPATPSPWDWVYKFSSRLSAHFAGAHVSYWSELGAQTEVDAQTRAMRKLSHGMGLLYVIGWDWDDPTFSQNGDTLLIDAAISARSIFKEP